MKKILIFLMVILITSCSSNSVRRDEKISKYFYTKDAIVSQVAKKRGIENIPNWQEMANIRYAAVRLDEVRRILKRPLVVTSWYRGEKLNRVVGGSKTSSHRNGLAIDIMLKKGEAGRKEFELVKKKMKSYDQLIYYPRRGHLHVGFKKDRKEERKQVMIK